MRSDAEPTMQAPGTFGLLAVTASGPATASTTYTFDNLVIDS